MPYCEALQSESLLAQTASPLGRLLPFLSLRGIGGLRKFLERELEDDCVSDGTFGGAFGGIHRPLRRLSTVEQVPDWERVIATLSIRGENTLCILGGGATTSWLNAAPPQPRYACTIGFEAMSGSIGAIAAEEYLLALLLQHYNVKSSKYCVVEGLCILLK